LATEIVPLNTVTYVIQIGNEIAILQVEDGGDHEMITVTKAGQTGYILAVDFGHESVTVGDWPDGEEWVVRKEYPLT